MNWILFAPFFLIGAAILFYSAYRYFADKENEKKDDEYYDGW